MCAMLAVVFATAATVRCAMLAVVFTCYGTVRIAVDVSGVAGIHTGSKLKRVR
jgi:hypothetical protein